MYKVMQIKNYDQVSNGDIGYIQTITGDENDATIVIDFGDGRIMEYENDQLKMLDSPLRRHLSQQKRCVFLLATKIVSQ